jgi:hypothetical protein
MTIMDTPETAIEREAAHSGHRALVKLLLWGLPLGAVAGYFMLFATMTRLAGALDFDHGSRCDGCQRVPMGSGVLRDGQPLGEIRQVAAPRRGRTEWMVLAPISGPVIDSARAGLLRATLTAGGSSDALWTVDLVSPTPGTRGEVVALLVTTSGLAPVPIYASPATR